MKKSLKTTLCSIILLACSQTAFAGNPLSAYAGTWANADPEGGITKVVITVKGSVAYVQAFGNCVPRDCDWGQVRSTAYSSSISTSPEKNTEAITAEYKSGPGKEVHIIENLVISMDGSGELHIRSLKVYTDDSGRNSQSHTYRFKKAG
ncbi:MAG: hypothetical protein KDD10_20580 [Phaeodactylibacter sp.]|nr:hypothetical protein [Phaeodactylibacter sp.]MCB9295863.1 hypothetical protein [Lewinellaceae bacterium]